MTAKKRAPDPSQLLETLIEEPWNADEILEPLPLDTKRAIRGALLERVAQAPSAEVVGLLGHFPDDEVVTALAQLVDDEGLDSELLEALPEALSTIGSPRAHKLIVGLLRLLDSDETDALQAVIEHLPGARAVELLLPRLDAIAAHGSDLVLLAAVEQLVAHGPKPAIVEALARHWDFALRHGETFMATNAIFDFLVEQAASSEAAQAAFRSAAAHADEYARVRGHAALALTGAPLTAHLGELAGLARANTPSTKELARIALEELVERRRRDLQALASGGDSTASKLLKRPR